jgi:hypothetical protein
MVAYLEVLPDAPSKDAPKDEILQYLRESHGDIEDAKATAIFVFDQRDDELEAEDIATITDEPPTSTFT